MGKAKPDSDDSNPRGAAGYVAAVPEILKQVPKKKVPMILLIAIAAGVGCYAIYHFAPKEKSPGSNTATAGEDLTSGDKNISVKGDQNKVTLNTGPGQQNVYNAPTTIVEPPTESEDDDGPPPPVPMDFPRLDTSKLPRLTDEQRKSPDYGESEVVIDNETDFNIFVAFSFTPNNTNPDRKSEYVASVRGPAYSKARTPFKLEKFGGPVHVSVYARLSKLSAKRWYKTDLWFDMGIVPSRTVFVNASETGFEVKVDLHKKEGP